MGKLHSGWSWSNSTVTRLLHEMTSLLWLRCCFTRIKWLQNRHYCLGVLTMKRPVQLTRTYHSYSWQQMLDINRTSSSPARCFNSFGQFGDWERLSFPEVEMFIRCNGRKVFSISWGDLLSTSIGLKRRQRKQTNFFPRNTNILINGNNEFHESKLAMKIKVAKKT